MELVKMFFAGLDAHFDKLLVMGLLVFCVMRGDEMSTRELLGALLVMVRGTVASFTKGDSK